MYHEYLNDKGELSHRHYQGRKAGGAEAAPEPQFTSAIEEERNRMTAQVIAKIGQNQYFRFYASDLAGKSFQEQIETMREYIRPANIPGAPAADSEAWEVRND